MAAPTISSLSPDTGPAGGGTAVLVTGTGFTGATAVAFGTVGAPSFTVQSDTVITATAPPHAAGDVGVRVTTADGTNSDDANNTYTYTAESGLFTVAEARAFDLEQMDEPEYSDSAIMTAEAEIREAWEGHNILDYALIPTVENKRYDGTGERSILLRRRKLTAVSAVTVYYSDGTTAETFDSDDLSDLAVYASGLVTRRSRGIFLAGDLNVDVTYTHGLASIPAELKRAALQLLVHSVVPSSVSLQATTFQSGEQTIVISRPGPPPYWYGLPAVDAVLARNRHRVPRAR